MANDWWDYLYARQIESDDVLCHHGILGQKWGVRRFQDEFGRLTPEGLERYRKLSDKRIKLEDKSSKIRLKSAKYALKADKTHSLEKDEKYNNKSKKLNLRSAKLDRKISKLDKEINELDEMNKKGQTEYEVNSNLATIFDSIDKAVGSIETDYSKVDSLDLQGRYLNMNEKERAELRNKVRNDLSKTLSGDNSGWLDDDETLDKIIFARYW